MLYGLGGFNCDFIVGMLGVGDCEFFNLFVMFYIMVFNFDYVVSFFMGIEVIDFKVDFEVFEVFILFDVFEMGGGFVVLVLGV